MQVCVLLFFSRNKTLGGVHHGALTAASANPRTHRGEQARLVTTLTRVKPTHFSPRAGEWSNTMVRERERVILRRRRGLVPATRTTRSKNARRARRTSGMLVHTAVPPLASVPAILVQGGGGVLRQNSGGLAVKERLKTQFCLTVCICTYVL
uniref:Uncharacterized protein n=1 Tax=Anopheles dirus TaxID=7168 RepID=A0A182NVZ6_9DIPT